MLLCDFPFTSRYPNEKIDPDLYMNSDPDDSDAEETDSGSSHSSARGASSAADMAKAYHKSKAMEALANSALPPAKSDSFSMRTVVAAAAAVVVVIMFIYLYTNQ